MFGRETERAQVEQMLEALPNGPVGLALEGSPGIGKTTVWREAVQAARARGYEVLETAPSEPDAALAFTGLGDLLDGLPAETLADLPNPQRRALGAALSISDTAIAPADQQALSRAVLGVLRRLAAESPVLVAIDDEQWLDRPTARVLAFALCRLREGPVGALVARRPNSEGALWAELVRGFAPDRLTTLMLGSLELADVEKLLSEQLDRRLPLRLLRRIYEVCAGNPLYALSIARELGLSNGHGAGGEGLPIPRALSEVIGQRLDRLDARANDPLLVVAALGGPTLATMQSVLPDFTLADLDGAVRADVIEIAGEQVRFTHPLLASAHYSRTLAARRRELHRLLAEVVSAEEERAHHLALGAEAPSHKLPLILEQAADHAARRGAPETAADLLEHAVRLTPADASEARHSRAMRAAEQHYVAGEFGDARSMLDALLPDLPAGALRARCLLQLGLLRNDDFDKAAALFEQALADAGNDYRLRAQIESELTLLLDVRGDPAAASEHARAAVELAERTADPGLLAKTLPLLARMAFYEGKGIPHEIMRRAIELEPLAEDISTYDTPSATLGHFYLWSDQLDAARPLLEKSLRRATDRGEEYDRCSLLFPLANLEWSAGNAAAASRYREELLEVLRQLNDDQGEARMLWVRSFVALRQGNLAEVRTIATAGVKASQAIKDYHTEESCATVLAVVDLWSGHPEIAHRHLSKLRGKAVSDGTPPIFVLINLWSCDIESLIAMDRWDEAQEVLEDLFDHARRAENPNTAAVAHRCRGLLLAARGSIGEAIEAMDEALVQHALRPLPFEVGRTLLEKGTLKRRAKRKSAAKRTLEEALAVLEPLEANLFIARARDELGRIGLRRATVTDGLTQAQTRVAELVLAGKSNREIASALYMSPRSVEAHLTKIYRHYGVKSRSQLATALVKTSLPTDDSDRTPDTPDLGSE
jgi:DNA-binding CsgD family transcriptional regulator